MRNALPGLLVRCRVLERFWIAILFTFLFCADASAHGNKPHNAEELLAAWSFEPLVVIGLAASGFLYGRGLCQLWRSGAGRGIQRWEAASYLAGWFALVLALVSPIHAWGGVLFSVHMSQHEILMLIAAPLLVLGRPWLAMLKALPLEWARAIARVGTTKVWLQIWKRITYPLVAWAIHGAALWVWHSPAWFQATLENETVHAFQHMSFLFSALLFWWAVVQGGQRIMGYGAAVLYLFTTALHSGLLGALITFAQRVVYPAYSGTTAWWGLTPLEDQQLGGLIMWIPAGLAYVIAGLALFAGWLRESETRARRNPISLAIDSNV